MIAPFVRVRIRSFRNALVRTRGSERIKAWVPLIASVVIGSGVGLFAYGIFKLLFESPTPAAAAIADSLPALGLAASFWILLISGISVGIGSLYTGREIGLLLAAPLTARGVFIAKFLDMTAANGAMFGLMGVPLVAAYGAARGFLSTEYALRGLVALGAFCAIPTAIGALLGMFAMRLLPAHRLREAMAAAGLVALAGGYIAVNVALHRMRDPSMAIGAADHLVRLARPTAEGFTPWAWAGEVVSTASGYPEPYIKLFLLIVTAILAVGFGSAAAEALYLQGWTAAQEATPRSRPAGAAPGGWEAALGALSPPLRAFVLKDIRSIARDVRQLSLLLMPIAVVVVYLLNLNAVSALETVPHALVSLTLLPLVGMIALRIAASAFIGEGSALWLPLTSPNGPRAILLGKLFYTILLTMPLSLMTLLVFGAFQPMTLAEWTAAAGSMGIAVTAMSGIAVGIGGRFMEVSPDASRGGLSGVSRLLAVGIQGVYGVGIALPAALSWVAVERFQIPAPLAYGTATAVILGISALALALPVAMAIRRLERLET